MKTFVLPTLLVGLLASCGHNNEPVNHTGSEVYKAQVGSLSTREEVQVGEVYSISTEALYVRSEDRGGEETKLGLLRKNDKVEILDNSYSFNGDFVEIKIIKTNSVIKESPTGKYFVSFKYIDDEETVSAFKYFVIQNIATERLRVYERDLKNNNHKMILETEVVVGDKDKGKSNLGIYEIASWHKFYRDNARHYPSWYDPKLPTVEKGGRATDWFNKKYMPEGGSMRGAFGWYTAKIKPNANYQWTHGTIGYGKESYKFIERTKKFWVNVVSDPRSSGCTRTNNEVIAYLRHILPIGTPIIKIYAKEKYADVTLNDLPEKFNTWDYILTKYGVRSYRGGDTADANSVMSKNISREDILDQGTYMIDIKPTAYSLYAYRDPVKCNQFINNFKEKYRRNGRSLPRTRSGALKLPKPSRRDGGERICDVVKNSKANVYKIDEENLSGYYFVDKGIVSPNYAHPSRDLVVSGHMGETVPGYMLEKK